MDSRKLLLCNVHYLLALTLSQQHLFMRIFFDSLSCTANVHNVREGRTFTAVGNMQLEYCSTENKVKYKLEWNLMQCLTNIYNILRYRFV